MGAKDEIGLKIRTMRKSRQMTQEDLAKAIGQSPSSITMYETGIRQPDFVTLEALSDVFNVSLFSLIPIAENDADFSDYRQSIVLQNMEQFGHLLQYMTQEEYDFVVAAFDKASERMREKGIEP
jgi:transcriptional regulator with XRE-family HTH domain